MMSVKQLCWEVKKTVNFGGVGMSKKKHQRRLNVSHKALVTTGIVVLLLILAVVAGVVVQMVQRVNQQKQDKSNFTTASSGLPQAIDKAQNESTAGDNSAAQSTISQALQSASTKAEKQALYVQQGIIFENQQQYDQAIASYKKAEALGITFTIALRIAQTAEEKGDKAMAIDYYKKTIANLDPKNPLHDADKDDFEAKIRALGGQL